MLAAGVVCAGGGADSGVHGEWDGLAVVIVAVVRDVAVFARVAVGGLSDLAVLMGVRIGPGKRQGGRKRGEETAQP